MKTVLQIVVIVCLIAQFCAGHTSVRVHRSPHRWLNETEAAQARSRAASFRAGTSVPLSGGLLSLGFYYVSIEVGTPATTYTVLFDTGSSNLGLSEQALQRSGSVRTVAFTSAACHACNPGGGSTNCPFGQPYPAIKDTTACGYGISYGGGSSFLSGLLVTDTVTFGGFTTEGAYIMAVDDQIPSGWLSGGAVDGIIGLAHELNACNPTWAPTIYSQMVKNNPTELPDLFGLCLDPSSGGVVDLGFIDTTKFKEPLQYVPVTQQRWYNMGLKDLAIGKISIGLPPFTFSYVNDQIGTFIDSGTSTMLFGPATFNAIQTVFQSNYCSLPGVCGSGSFFDGNCLTDAQMGSKLSQFPDFVFTFVGEKGDVVLNVPSSAYFLHANGQYCFGVASVVGISAVLGDVFMENFYIVHDRVNQRVGFSPIVKCT